ncbi:MAG: hypothetical protein ACI8W8_003730 [Rhodothermales bacterium]|jgi:hypothetical protein
MSHIIAPEITISSTPLLLELCSESFELRTHDLALPDLEDAAKAIKEACSVTSHSIKTAKSNLLLAYMADGKCRRWLKKEFQDRVDCDNTLLSTMARKAGFKFYTNDSIIMEELEQCDEETSNEEIAKRAGVSQKAVERVKVKLEKKREDELLTQQIALEVAIASDKDESPREESLAPEFDAVPRAESERSEPESDDSADVMAESRVPSEKPGKTAPSLEQVKIIASKVKKKIEADYLKEIDVLKKMLLEKDAEISRLQALLQR